MNRGFPRFGAMSACRAQGIIYNGNQFIRKFEDL